MDARRFDSLTRSLAAPTTRRGVLAGLAALGALAAATAGNRAGAGAAQAACVDECAAVVNQRARAACARACARRAEAAASTEARIAEAEARAEARGVIPPSPVTTAAPPPPRSCPAGRVGLANGSCAFACAGSVRCPDGCVGCATADPASAPALFCTAGFPPDVRPCASTAECPQGRVCIGRPQTGEDGVVRFLGLCQTLC